MTTTGYLIYSTVCNSEKGEIDKTFYEKSMTTSMISLTGGRNVWIRADHGVRIRTLPFAVCS